MKRTIAALVAALALGGGAVVVSDGAAVAAPPVHPDLDAVATFALALGDDLEGDVVGRLSRYDLVVVDGEYVETSDVASLRAGDTIVLAYLSVGTIESYRSWYKDAKPYRLDLWDDWGEWYADVKAKGFRDLIANEVAPVMLAKGVDGLFLDNVDMVETHPGRTNGMHKLVTRLSNLVDADEKLLFAQNGADIMGPMLGMLDGWNQEDVSLTYDWDGEHYRPVSASDRKERVRALRQIRNQGIFVTSTDYWRKKPARRIERAVARACRAGAIPWVADIELTRLAGPYTCD